jgi:FkbM family methyltransferase
MIVTKNLKRFGSLYGGWTVFDHKSLYEGIVFSAGVGEDISFDIELYNEYKAKIVLIDPTPRSIDYFTKLKQYCGLNKSEQYSFDGYQNFLSYDLSKVKRDTLHYMPFALAATKGVFPFYPPENSSYVSHSLNPTQFTKKTKPRMVNTISYEDLIQNLVAGPALLKLDIEGSEPGVMLNAMSSDKKPLQICVEFDFMKSGLSNSQQIYTKLITNANKNGYQIVHNEGHNYLFCNTCIL